MRTHERHSNAPCVTEGPIGKAFFTGRTYRKLDSHTATDRHGRSRMNQALRWVELRKSRIHGRGVFARRDIPAGTRLIEYVGLPISKKKSAEMTLKQNRFLFTL